MIDIKQMNGTGNYSAWNTAARARTKSRDEYAGGPAAGPGILAMYRDLINAAVGHTNSAEKKVLVLGATPEIRDLALEADASVVAVDIDRKILHDMTELMHHKHSPKEEILEANWLTMPLSDNEFDLVVGDGITNNITGEEHDQLFSELKRILKPGGHILLRDVVRQDPHPRRSIQEIVEAAHKENWHRYELWFEIYFFNSEYGYNPKTQTIEMGKIEKRLEEKYYNTGLFTPQEEAYFKKFMKGAVKTTWVEKTKWLEKFSQHFNLVKIDHPQDFRYCEYFKFFLGQKKI